MLEEYLGALRLVNTNLTSYTPKLGCVFHRLYEMGVNVWNGVYKHHCRRVLSFNIRLFSFGIIPSSIVIWNVKLKRFAFTLNQVWNYTARLSVCNNVKILWDGISILNNWNLYSLEDSVQNYIILKKQNPLIFSQPCFNSLASLFSALLHLPNSFSITVYSICLRLFWEPSAYKFHCV